MAQLAKKQRLSGHEQHHRGRVSDIKMRINGLYNFELTGFREETVLEKDRFGVESGELILSTEGQERDAINEENNKMAVIKA